jgi:hypothetical protein
MGVRFIFQPVKGEGLPPHLLEVELREAGLLGVATGGARSRASSRGAPRPTIWGGWGRRAGRDIGLLMGSRRWVGRLGRLRCQELLVVAQRLKKKNYAAI